MSCNYSTVIGVSPTSATVNQAAAPPGNQVQFIAFAHETASGPGCAIPQSEVLVYGTWSNPDPQDIQISSANDSTNGTAVCKAPTTGAVTLTVTFTQFTMTPATKSVQLTCK